MTTFCQVMATSPLSHDHRSVQSCHPKGNVEKVGSRCHRANRMATLDPPHLTPGIAEKTARFERVRSGVSAFLTFGLPDDAKALSGP